MHMVISMSRRGNSPDNEACETWFSSFKKECIYLYQRNELNLNNIYEIVSNYIEFYNFVRPIISQRKTPFEQRMEFFNKKIFFLSILIDIFIILFSFFIYPKIEKITAVIKA
ncbi:hypothetical protein [Spiroplasma endosymbiont of Phyllotreta cruciferae]|uniref:hypothetical protein n=1 Tax=Spiroplasma endosymbiont of Phyllotreta cruciferae TaxID=2886375 RepID=UPI0020A192C2|nr:hypothetical protein [Spiroplasma endosymbiont of Phyllotreta cruciferae]